MTLYFAQVTKMNSNQVRTIPDLKETLPDLLFMSSKDHKDRVSLDEILGFVSNIRNSNNYHGVCESEDN